MGSSVSKTISSKPAFRLSKSRRTTFPFGASSLVKKNKFYESNKLNLGAKKAKLELKWKTILNQKKTVDFIFEWYNNYLNRVNMKNFSIQQIKKFYRMAKIKNI